MYVVYLINAGKQYTILDLSKDTQESRYHLDEPVWEQSINTDGSFSFRIPANSPNVKRINPLVSIIKVDRNGSNVFCGRVTNVEMDFFGNKQVTASGGLSYLSDSVQTPKKYSKVTPKAFLQDIVNKHNAFCNRSSLYESDKQIRWAMFEVGTVNVTGSLECYTKWETTLESISTNLIDNFGGYIKATLVDKSDDKLHYRLDYRPIPTPSEDNVNTWVNVGENILDYSADISAVDLCTAVVPIGKSTGSSQDKDLDDSLTLSGKGDLYVYNDNLVKKYGWHFKVLRLSDVDNTDKLIEEGTDYITQHQYDKAVFNLHAIDPGYKKGGYMRIGDVIGITDWSGQKAINVLTAYSINLIDPSRNTYTVGFDDNRSFEKQMATYVRKDGTEIKRPGVV